MPETAASGPVRYSIVVPIYNEEAVLPVLLKRLDALMDSLDGPAEAIFVDDGSRDCGSIFLEAKAKDNPRYRYLKLTRNFGHQIAITAGMDVAEGAAVVVMDADLQDPPEVVRQMIARWKDGYDIVYARRLSREGEGRFKRWTAGLFYKVLSRLSSVDIPRDVGDFRLIDRKVLQAFRGMPEQDRFVRGMFAWLGFNQTEVTFHRPPRVAGETKYPFWKMVRLAVSGVIGFSDAPLKLAIWLGLTFSGLAVLYGLYAIGLRLFGGNVVTGWSSTIVVISFLCGVNMLMTGIMGLYIGRIHAEVKRRPLYVVDRRVGFERGAAAASDAAKKARPLDSQIGAA
ncbi:MAG TPA: glycosyltransferase family 2 protein [Pseudorhodoplanes sp.]|nr:glycosyltransferase family 2 protein [Pseudorhodoplanes sp.]